MCVRARACARMSARALVCVQRMRRSGFHSRGRFVSVPSAVTNWVTTVNGCVVSTVKPACALGEKEEMEPETAPGSATGVPKADFRKHIDDEVTKVNPTQPAVELHVAQQPNVPQQQVLCGAS